MKSFKQHINESIGTSYPYDIDNIDGDGTTTEYQLSFSGKACHYYVMIIADLKQKVIRIDFSDEEGESTISGMAGTDAFKIFGTLGDMLHKALIQHPGFAIQFEGYNSEPSKVKAYRAFAKRVAQRLHGTVKEKQAGINTRFVITPPQVRPNK